ncbi:MAG: glycosyltransferase family 2 protein [Luteolibacter sp.]
MKSIDYMRMDPQEPNFVVGHALILAVIIPAYNRRGLLLETLESVRSQTVAPGRVVIVDDGSADGTAEVAEKWLSTHLPDSDVKVIRQANAGVSAARNRGARECEDADLLTFLDSDDLWPVDFVQQALLAFSMTPEIVAATNDRLDVEYLPDGRTEKLFRWPISGRSATLAISNKNLAYPSCTVFKTAAFQQVGGFPTGLNYGEDYVFSLVVSSFGPWGRIDSLPTQRRKFSNSPAQAAEHLSALPSADVLRSFASILEAEALKHQCAGSLKQAITHRWRRAGKALAVEGRTREARDCYARAVGCDAWDVKARFRNWMLGFAR